MSYRCEKVAGELKKIIASKLVKDLQTSLPGFVSVSQVKVSKDLRNAWVYFAIYGAQAGEQEVLAILNSQKSFLKKEVSQQLKMHYTPNLIFMLDDGSKHFERINNLLKKSSS